MDIIIDAKPAENKKPKKWLWAGIVIALLNPIFSGLILGSLYLTEPDLKKYGKIILALAVVWGAIVFLSLNKLYPNPLPGVI